MRLSFSILCIIASGFLGECGSKENSSTIQNLPKHKGNVSEIASVESRGRKAPNFSWTTPSGRRTTFDQFHDRVTVFNFWATWCGPCRREIPDLEAIHKELSAKGVKVLGISVDKGATVLDDVHAFAESLKISYPIVIDNGDLERLFGNIRAIPTTFIINREGKIVEMMIGQRAKQTFLQKIAPYME